MAHSVSEQAARAVKNSQRIVKETRTDAEIFKAIRGNLGANLAVTPNDQRFLLGAYDAEKEFSHKLAEESIALKAQVDTLTEYTKNAAKSTFDLQCEIARLQAIIDVLGN